MLLRTALLGLLCTAASADTVIVRFAQAPVSLNASFVPAPALPNATLQYQLSSVDMAVYTLDAGVAATAYCAGLANVSFCSVDGSVVTSSTSPAPDDPLYPQQYGLTQADVPAAWRAGALGNASVRVCMIDTGVDLTHPDLRANLWTNPAPTFGDVHGAAFIGGRSNATQDQNGHGTRTAGIVGATTNNGIGVAGVAQAVGIVPCRFMDASGSGSVSDAVACIDYCLGVGAHVLSNSWGSSAANVALIAALQAAVAQGALVVASAGNDALDVDTHPHYPSEASRTLAGVLSIAATTQAGGLWPGSNYGTVAVQCAAPGVNVMSTTLGGGYSNGTGTSFAAPQASGVAALLLGRMLSLGYAIDRSPSATRAVAWAIANATRPFALAADQARVNGTLDAARALDALDAYLAGQARPGGPAISSLSASVIGFLLGVVVSLALVASAAVVHRRWSRAAADRPA